MIIVAAVETAMIKRLEAAGQAGVLGYAFRSVDTLPSDLDDRFAEYIQQMPAAWTVFNGWKKVEDLGDSSTLVEARFSVVVGASNLRNERAQRHGAGEKEVGSYQLVADVAGLLAGQDFGLPISALSLGDCSPLYAAGDQAARKASIFAVSFTCQVELDPLAPALIQTPAVGDFITFSVGWDVPPHSGEADLGQTIVLQQED